MISRRGSLSLLASAGAVLLAVYTLNLLLLAGAIAVFAAIGGELLRFHLRALGAADFPFEATRNEAPRVLSPGTGATVELVVRYQGTRPVQAEVRELLPSPLTLVAGRASETRFWRRGDAVRLRYGVRAGSRGSHLLGPVAVTVESPHGLAWAQWTLPSSHQPVRVVPQAPIEKAHRIGPALLTRMQGRITLRRRGFGTEFRSLRPYQLSDDIRHVAWKRSRPGQWYVREFEQESRQDFVLLLDVTPAMTAGLPGENALDRAIEAASLVIAAVARGREDRVGLLTYTEKPRQYLRPERGEFHFRRLAENLAYLRPSEGTFDLAAALDLLTKRLSRNTHVLAFSALDGPRDRLHSVYARFRTRGHRLYVFPPHRSEFYPPLPPTDVAEIALGWAEAEERGRLDRTIAELRGEGIPTFPYDRRGATTQVLSTYGQLHAWGMA
ncbi:MAG: DUF58 domain-containing protein [Thermoplasmata archaeon]|nr:DUF58 domain-containing protein [Thermoplasmata archaeon]